MLLPLHEHLGGIRFCMKFYLENDEFVIESCMYSVQIELNRQNETELTTLELLLVEPLGMLRKCILQTVMKGSGLLFRIWARAIVLPRVAKMSYAGGCAKLGKKKRKKRGKRSVRSCN